jgi:hypothetical protein
MIQKHVYVFLRVRDWEFYAVEAENSDDALWSCLQRRGWNLWDLVYLGRVEGPLPPHHLNDRWYPGAGPPGPPEIREPVCAYG